MVGDEVNKWSMKGKIMIDEKELLKQFGYSDYPITYQDGSHGRGMGYGDFEKLLKKLIKEQKKNKPKG